NDCINIQFIYNTSRFDEQLIMRISEHFCNILSYILEKPDEKLSEIDMLTKEEKDQILYEFNNTYADYPRNKTLHELFEEKVEKIPDNIAVVSCTHSGEMTLSYRELNEKANSLARTLREMGVKSDSIVGILVDRSLEMMVGIFGILKAGGAYLPINPNYPKERVGYMLKDSGANILLTHEYLVNEVPFRGQVIALEDEQIYLKAGSNLEPIKNSQGLAYIIYTSGSTGKPKGVMVSHKALNNFLFNMYNSFGENLGQKDNCLSLTNISFDVSICEISIPLVFGATLVLYNNEMILDIYNLVRTIVDKAITFAYIPPTILKEVYERLSNEEVKLNKMLVGVEPIKDYILEDYLKLNENMQIINGYGPTEATICATFYKYGQTAPVGKNVPIGKPLANTQIYILDQYSNPVPQGVVGELCISGEGLAEGYLNGEDLTIEKFVPNPFIVGMKMYKTGDMARLLPSGIIKFVGRIDHQVKIRGFRIELGEVESQLLNCDSIKKAIVVDREDKNGAKYLCAYVVSEEEVTVGDFTPKELRAFLLTSLPEYMIPSCFVQLDQMPLTANGKIDRKGLPVPEGNIMIGTEYEAPQNKIEEKLVEFWKELLGMDKIGTGDNFFELGGHSLKATKLVGKIHKVLNVEVPLSEMFRTPTIKGISSYIKSATKIAYEVIEKVDFADYYEASSAQKRMFMLQQFDLQSTGYNMPGVLEVKGRLNIDKVKKAFYELIRRHETLRTSFETIEDKIVQRINSFADVETEFKVELLEKTDKTIEEILNEFIRPFDLTKAFLFRVGVIEVEENKSILMYDMHHIISDGVSMGILVNEFASFYEGKELDNLRIQYKDFTAWQNKLLRSDVMKEHEKYWLNRFRDLTRNDGQVLVLNMPTDFARPIVKSHEGDSINFRLDKELTKDIQKIAKETDSTMYMVLLSTVNILLSKYSSQEDIIIGSPIAGRPHFDLENIIGMFVNTLAMRNYPESKKTFKEFLMEVKENALEAYEHQEYQFEELVDKLDLRRNTSRNPLFDVMFVLQNIEMQNFYNGEIKIEDLELKQYDFKNKIAKFDLTISASEVVSTEADSEITFNFDYSTKLYKRETVERMISYFTNILKAVTIDTDIKLSEIDMLTEEEKYKILYQFNDTKTNFPKEKTLSQLFEEQVEKRPDNIAVVYEDKQLTYRELNEKANRLARTLRKNGVKSNSYVGILVERSLEMIFGIMGILKAGGAYLPIGSKFPKDRIEYMLKNSQSEILLTQKKFLNNELTSTVETINLEDEEIFTGNCSNLEPTNTSFDLAYAIYTSGSTGKQKGVMIEHKSVISLVTGLAKIIYERYGSYLNVALVAPYFFDASVKQIFASLLLGHKLCIVPEDARIEGKRLLRFYRKNYIDISDGTPTHINLLLNIVGSEDNDLNVKHFIIGGEELSSQVVKNFFKRFKDCKFYITNIYGPTECCVDTTSYLIAPEKLNSLNTIPIGKPIANEIVYILGKNLEILPVGVSGEIYISGEGIAKGYLNNPNLTTEKFIQNPFILGARMYRTGDLAKWLPDGNIEFLGRIDNQVKIRGYRIELGEIESQILNHKAIKEAIVIARVDKNNSKFLCAYIVADKEVTVGELTPKELREFLLKKLLKYMIPSYFVQLDKMPLTPNGKIDRKALPKPDGNIVIGTEYEAPRNQTEEKLVKIWSEILGVEKVGINDDFFELGGHSLKATVLTGKILKELNVEVPLSEIFRTPTIKGISDYIQSAIKIAYEAIEKVDSADYYEASSAQKRMYMLQQFDLQSIGYNMPGVLEVKGELNLEKVKNAFYQLIRRHETLRTSFETIKEKIVQRVNSFAHVEAEFNCAFTLEYIEKTEKTIEEAVNEFIRPFDLSKAPLFRVGVIEVEENKSILMFDMHHIISDGISMGLLVSEFTRLYEGKELDVLRIQYKDYAEWQNTLLRSDIMKKQEAYWINKFSDEAFYNAIPVLNMPTDYPRPTMQSIEGDNIRCTLDKELTEELKTIAKEMNSTMYMVLLSGVNILLSKYSGQEDIIVGSPIAGRPHPDLEKIIGMFVNTLAMRNNPDGNETYKEFLQQVRKNALEAYGNQDYQFEELVEQLDLSRDMSRNPLFDVMFAMQNMLGQNWPWQNFYNGELRIDNLELKPYNFDYKTSKFDLTISATEIDDEIILNFEYSTRLYKRETIERMLAHFRNILIAVAGDADIKLSEIEMLNKEEKDQVLYEFNNTDVDYPEFIIIQQIFERQVAKTPDKLAVVFEDQELSYKTLNEKANQLAWRLRNKGVKADTIVGIMLNRSLELIIGIMGILKAGGAYLPIDPTYPENRIEYMVKDSEIDLLLTERGYLSNVDFAGKILDVQDESIYTGDSSNLDVINQSHHLAYIIYTSGSTGTPKGVMIEHRNLVRLLFNDQFQFDFNEEDVWTMFHSQCFDFSVWEIFGALLYGGKLVVIPKLIAQNPDDYLEILLKEKVTVVNQTPTSFYNLSNSEMRAHTKSSEKELKVRYIIFGGEALKPVMLKAWKERYPKTRLINMYGITETTVHVTFKEIFDEDIEIKISNVGTPIPTLKVYILDKHKHLLPCGVPGELCVTGAGVARGYLNRPELTEKKFIKNPFKINDSEERLYCSGDYAKRLPDGNIEYLGRIDRQVKIRGFRIELGEIENQLLNYNPIKEAIVVDSEDKNGSKYLCAYVVTEQEVTVGKLREFLLKILPEYMIPSYFVQLDEIPLTANGKIDRKALPEPEGNIVVGTEYETPRNETEEKLVEMWKDVLGIEKAGINDNFFELGGHSLKATILAAKMHKELDVEVSLSEIFKRPTIKGISEYIQNATKTSYEKIEKVEPADYYEASSAQ
ncbi:MAG: amino acid adenylation domain-containing protein, partial [Halanaerobiales bacterium]|nr:amino acid adenylation domain-containing protein [Halanaerobiales bacterium]